MYREKRRCYPELSGFFGQAIQNLRSACRYLVHVRIHCVHSGSAHGAELSRGGLREQESQAVRLPGWQDSRRRSHRRHLGLGSRASAPRAVPATVTRPPVTWRSPRTRPVAVSASPRSTRAARAASRGPPMNLRRSSVTSRPSPACRRRSRSPAEPGTGSSGAFAPLGASPCAPFPTTAPSPVIRFRLLSHARFPPLPSRRPEWVREVAEWAAWDRCDGRGSGSCPLRASLATSRHRIPTVRF